MLTKGDKEFGIGAIVQIFGTGRKIREDFRHADELKKVEQNS